MIIAVAGKYTAPTKDERTENFNAMNNAAARLLEMGHTPLIGVNAALPVVERSKTDNEYEAIMRISLATVENADAILVISDSKGVQREKELIERSGKPVFNSIDEIPPAT